MVNATYVEGIVCPKCGCPDLRVWSTRKAWGGKIRRVRICDHCGQRITTTETTPRSLPESGPLMEPRLPTTSN
jgi:hypothetical protein